MLTVPGADGCDQLVDDGGDSTVLLHSGARALSLLLACRFQGCAYRQRAGSDAGFESAARVHRHRSGPVLFPVQDKCALSKVLNEA